MRRNNWRRGYGGTDSVLPVVGDVMQNASPSDHVHPDDPSPSDAHVAAQLDSLAVTAGGAVQQGAVAVAQAPMSTVGWVALAVGAWLLFKD